MLRRDFLKAGGALVIGFPLIAADAPAAGPGATVTRSAFSL